MPPFVPENARCRSTTPCRGSPACRRTATKPSACWATARHLQWSCLNRPTAGAWAPCYSSTVRNLLASQPCCDQSAWPRVLGCTGFRSGHSNGVLLKSWQDKNNKKNGWLEQLQGHCKKRIFFADLMVVYFRYGSVMRKRGNGEHSW